MRLATFIKNGENPNYHAFFHGVERVAAEAGATTTRHIPSTPDDPQQQIALLRAVTAERPDAIIFAPADDDLLAQPIAAAIAAGIPVIGYVNRMPGDFVTFIGADDIAMGRMAIAAIATALDGHGTVVLLEGPDTAPTARDRGRGFREGLAEAPGLHLLDTAPGRNLEAPGRAAMAALLARHPRIDGVVCANDQMALGALAALDDAHRTARVTGMNGVLRAIEAIASGRMLATIDFDGFRMGAIAAMAALRHLRGQPVPRQILLPTTVIDRANHRPWLVPIDRRPLPAWEAAHQPEPTHRE